MEANIVQKLIGGQAAIDRMREEINQVVRQLIGWTGALDCSKLPYFDNQKKAWCLAFSTDKGFWKVISRSEQAGIQIWVVIGTNGLVGWNQENTRGSLVPSDVKLAYENLPMLVEALFLHLPQLKEKAMPILEAADCKF